MKALNKRYWFFCTLSYVGRAHSTTQSRCTYKALTDVLIEDNKTTSNRQIKQHFLSMTPCLDIACSVALPGLLAYFCHACLRSPASCLVAVAAAL
jgi:hypothetical protein